MLSVRLRPGIKSKSSWTPLQIAADAGFKAGCEILLEAGAIIDYKNKDGETAIDVVTRRVGAVRYSVNALYVETQEFLEKAMDSAAKKSPRTEEK